MNNDTKSLSTAVADLDLPASTAELKAKIMMNPLTALHDELNRITWEGEDEGWNLAITAVQKRISEILMAPVAEGVERHPDFWRYEHIANGLRRRAEKAEAELEKLRAATASDIAAAPEQQQDDIRAQGWSVAVHNDYRLNGEAHTFWLFTKDGRAVKGEGKTDAEALAQVRAEIGIAAQPAEAIRTDMLRTCVRDMTRLLKNGEWADLLCFDDDAAALESEIASLIAKLANRPAEGSALVAATPDLMKLVGQAQKIAPSLATATYELTGIQIAWIVGKSVAASKALDAAAPAGIPVEHEDIEELKKWGMGLANVQERCHFCNSPTRYWHTPTNTPCCESCAAKHDVSELPRGDKQGAQGDA